MLFHFIEVKQCCHSTHIGILRDCTHHWPPYTLRCALASTSSSPSPLLSPPASSSGFPDRISYSNRLGDYPSYGCSLDRRYHSLGTHIYIKCCSTVPIHYF